MLEHVLYLCVGMMTGWALCALFSVNGYDGGEDE